jgi:ribosomal protein S11
MKRVILVISSAFALGFWSEVFAESFGCPKPYSSPNPMSDTWFAKTYGGTSDDWALSVQQTSDGGYIVAGYTESFSAGGYDFFLIKTDANGNIIWAKTYGGIASGWASSVQQTSDGGYIVADCASGDIFLIKTDANGNIIWAKTYGGIGYDDAYSVQQTSDGGYIVAGITWSFGAGSADIFLIKTDANGNIIWAKTYGGIGYDDAYSVQQTSDGGYIVVGTTRSFGAGSYDIFLIKTDANGNIIWAKTYGGTDRDGASSVQQTSDGGYIVAGYTESFGAGYSDAFLIKTDANGNIIWAKTYGGTYGDYACSVQQTSDGGYIVAGYGDIFLIKTDANGNIIWAKTYGGTYGDYAYSVQHTSDGGYIVAGGTYSFGAGYSDAFLIKTDANGDIGSCSIVQNTNPSVTAPSPTVITLIPYVESVSPAVNSVSPTVTSPTPTVHELCPLSISESCQITSGIITPYKGGIKVSGSGEFEVKVYNVSGVMVKSARGENEVKLELSRGVYFVEVISGGKTIREKVVVR